MTEDGGITKTHSTTDLTLLLQGCVVCNKDGHIITSDCVDGPLHGEHKISRDNVIIHHSHWIHGQKHSLEINCYDDGNLSSQTTFASGKYHSDYKKWTMYLQQHCGQEDSEYTDYGLEFRVRYGRGDIVEWFVGLMLRLVCIVTFMIASTIIILNIY